MSGVIMSVTRKTLASALQKRLKISTEDAQELLGSILSIMEEHMVQDNELKIVNFGSFYIQNRRQKVCPINNKPVKTVKNMRFCAASQLSNTLKRDDDNDDFFM